MKRLVSVIILLFISGRVLSTATLYQSIWYTSYTPADGTKPDFHSIGMSFSTTSDPQTHNGITPIITVSNDNDTGNDQIIGTVLPTTSTQKRLKNFLPLIGGAHIRQSPYVMYEITQPTCVTGEQPYITAKIRYFLCKSSANDFADTLLAIKTNGGINMLTHDGVDFDVNRSYVISTGTYADIGALIKEVKGENTTICPA